MCNGRINTMFNRVLEDNMNSIIKVLSGVHKTVALRGMRVHKDGRISIQARWIREDALGENDTLIYKKMQYGKDGVELGFAGWAVKGFERVTKEQLISNPNAGIGAYLKTSDIYTEACGTDRSENPEWFTQMCKDISKFGGYVRSVRKNQSTRTQTTEVKDMTNTNGSEQTTSPGSPSMRMNRPQLVEECNRRELVVKGNDTKKTLLARIQRFDGNQTTAPAPVEVDPRVAQMEALQAQLDALSAELNGNQPAPAPVKTTAPAEENDMTMKEQRAIFKQMKSRNGGPLDEKCEGMSLKDALAQGLVTKEAIIAFKATNPAN